MACRWLQGHEDVWKPWLPDPTRCFSGFGLYHQPSSSFVPLSLQPSCCGCKIQLVSRASDVQTGFGKCPIFGEFEHHFQVSDGDYTHNPLVKMLFGGCGQDGPAKSHWLGVLSVPIRPSLGQAMHMSIFSTKKIHKSHEKPALVYCMYIIYIYTHI